MNSSDSAEQTVRLTLEGMEVAFRIVGAGAKNIAVMLYTIMKDQEQTLGKARLKTMLKTGKPLTIFTIKSEDLKKFSQEAENYGILYCSLTNKKDAKIDGMVDILVREEDAAKINRIAERFNFEDVATIQKELEQAKQSKQNKGEKLKTEDEQFIDDIMPVEKGVQKEIPSNTDNMEEKNLSEISYDTKPKDKKEISSEDEKKSVIQELKEIENELETKEKVEVAVTEKQEVTVEIKHTKEKKTNKSKSKGKHYKQPKHLRETPKGKGKRAKIKQGRSK